MLNTTCYSLLDSPLGVLCVQGDGEFLTGLYLPTHRGQPETHAATQQSEDSFATVREQLTEFFAGQRLSFDPGLST